MKQLTTSHREVYKPTAAKEGNCAKKKNEMVYQVPMTFLGSDATKVKRCVFASVSTCRDLVGDHICNAHLALFGLLIEEKDHTDGNNENYQHTNTYIISANALSIPLFEDTDGTIQMPVIHRFAKKVCNQFPNINKHNLTEVICKLVGVHFSGDYIDCDSTWLSLQSTGVICRNMVSSRYLKRIPKLHQYLFEHTYMSNKTNVLTGKTTVRVANVTTMYNESDNMVSFTMIEACKPLTLKYTSNPVCVATPIILEGYREVATQNERVCYQPTMPVTQCY